MLLEKEGKRRAKEKTEDDIMLLEGGEGKRGCRLEGGRGEAGRVPRTQICCCVKIDSHM